MPISTISLTGVVDPTACVLVMMTPPLFSDVISRHHFSSLRAGALDRGDSTTLYC